MKEYLTNNDEAPSAIQGIPLHNIESLSHTGIYSTVWKAQVYESDYRNPTEVIVKRYEVDPTTLDTQLKDWDDYRKIIALHEVITGISIPRTLAVEANESNIFFVDELLGDRDVSKVLADKEIDLDKRHQLAATLLESISKIPRDEHQQTAFMIDGKFSNFCLDDKGKISYVDLFPAHARNGVNHLLKPSSDHLEQKRSLYTDSFVIGDIYGILGRLMGTLRKDHPDLWATIQDSQPMQAVFENLPLDLREYCTFLVEDDALFVQAIYNFGIQNPKIPQFDSILNPVQYKAAQQ